MLGEILKKVNDIRDAEWRASQQLSGVEAEPGVAAAQLLPSSPRNPWRWTMSFAFNTSTPKGGHLDSGIQSAGTAILARVLVRAVTAPAGSVLSADCGTTTSSSSSSSSSSGRADNSLLPSEGRVMRCEVPCFKAILFNVRSQRTFFHVWSEHVITPTPTFL